MQGIPGEYISTARRSRKDWFVGTITNNDAREIKLDLSFLEPGKKYKATIYSDDPSVNTETHVRVSSKSVNSKTVLKFALLPSGGEAVYLTPEK
ncbi:glycoside hydrolase family 97 C-terminal domain-containing protein [Mucilaginibacter sp. P19]|uniref:glycoside hydrolase family 97 C-terminal domain-containing protein n=1 Tax=Mucilaginibacter sp. P19 TaxID=3423947 RepID=UPI003D67D01D